MCANVTRCACLMRRVKLQLAPALHSAAPIVYQLDHIARLAAVVLPALLSTYRA
jgi:hypothetical protein